MQAAATGNVMTAGGSPMKSVRAAFKTYAGRTRSIQRSTAHSPSTTARGSHSATGVTPPPNDAEDEYQEPDDVHIDLELAARRDGIIQLS
jgi:hypothetical protein